MDPAVGLVQSYLRLNGFFTVTEYPVVATARDGTHTLTDADILAVRFPAAERWVPGLGREPDISLATDERLRLSTAMLDMIIGEVKEGKPHLNETVFWEPVIESVVRRFGCCEKSPAETARSVLQSGHADTLVGGMPCHIRMVIFGGTSFRDSKHFEVIPLDHILRFVHGHIEQHRDIFLHTQLKDDALDLMALMVKLGVHI